MMKAVEEIGYEFHNSYFYHRIYYPFKMKKLNISLWVLSLTIIFTQIAQAQDPDVTKQMEKAARQAYKDLLKETDKNNDGKISKAEFYAIWKDKKVAGEKYIVWDLNKDGYITEEEYVKAVRDITTKKKK